MNIDSHDLSVAAGAVVIACWWVYAVLFLFRKRHPKGKPQKRDRTSLVGVGLLGAAYAIVWFMHRPVFSPLFELGQLIDWTIAVVAIFLSIGSVGLLVAAIRTLGRQWSITAQVVDSHLLVREGPYSLVRHPIFAGMLGMLISTGLAFSQPVWLLVGSVLAWYGTHLRIKREEALLAETFGEQYKEYSLKVPALIPGIKWIK